MIYPIGVTGYKFAILFYQIFQFQYSDVMSTLMDMVGGKKVYLQCDHRKVCIAYSRENIKFNVICINMYVAQKNKNV